MLALATPAAPYDTYWMGLIMDLLGGGTTCPTAQPTRSIATPPLLAAATLVITGSLATALPDPCTWKGPSWLGTQFGNSSGSGLSGFEMRGDADGQRLAECATRSSRDVLAAVSFYMNDKGSDAGLW